MNMSLGILDLEKLTSLMKKLKTLQIILYYKSFLLD